MKTGYISTRDAALRSKLRPEYIAQLCREGKLDGAREDGAWLVLETSLASFVLKQKSRRSEVAKDLSQKRKIEYETRLLSTKSAALEVGCTVEYIAQLCREGKLAGKQIGREWKVDAVSLSSYMLAREVERVQVAKKLAEERRIEYRKNTAQAVAPAAVQLVSAIAQVPQIKTNRAVSLKRSFAQAALALIFTVGFIRSPYALQAERGVSLALSPLASMIGADSSLASPGSSGSALDFMSAFGSSVKNRFFAFVGLGSTPTTVAVVPVQKQPDPYVVPIKPTVAAPPANPGPVAVATPKPAPSVIERIVRVEVPVNRTIVQPVQDRIITLAGVSEKYVQDQIAILRNSIPSGTFSGTSYQYPSSPNISQSYANTAVSQRIDQLSGTTLTNATVHGVSGLTDSDVPNDITASLYLPLAGGTLAGDLLVNTITASSTSGTSTLPHLSLSSFALGADYLTSLTGPGISIINGALTFSGSSFSTTSANYWKSVTDLFSTTSASNFLSVNQGNAFSTTSASFFADASTTIPKTYSSNTFTAVNNFSGIINTGAATTTSLYIADVVRGAGLTSCSSAGDKIIWNALTGQFSCGADAGAGGSITALAAQYSSFQAGASQTFATSTLGTDFSITSASNVHTFNLPSSSLTNRGLLTAADYALFNNKISSSSLSATSPLAYNSSTGTFSIQAANGSQNGYLASGDFTTFNSKISSTSLDTSLKLLSLLADETGTGSAVFSVSPTFTGTITGAAQTLSSTLGVTGLSTLGGFLSTASSTVNSTLAVVGATTLGSTLNVTGQTTLATSLSGILKATVGVVSAATAGADYENPLTFSYPLLRSTNALSLAFGTSSSNTWGGTQTFTSTIAGSITGNAATATALQNARNINGTSFDGTTNITITAASSTLLANNNSFSGVNAFTGNTTFANATSTNLALTSVVSTLLKTNSSGSIIPAVSGADYAAGNVAYPFALTGNATSTLTQFNGGLTAFASSTIGAGGATTGLTIFGTATTTGNHYFGTAGSVLSTDQGGAIELKGTGATNPYFDLASSITRDYDFRLQLTPANNLFSISASSTQNILNILGNGNVGIGTTSPSLTLSVQGNGYISGTSFFGGAITATSTLLVSGATTLSGTLGVTGLSTLGGFLSTASSTVNGTFVATGATTLGSTLSVTGQTTLATSLSGVLKATAGVVSVATPGTDYTTFGYLFPSNATSTLLTFSGGLTSAGQATFLNASSTAFSANTLSIGGTGTTSIASNGTLTTPALTIASLTGLLKSTSGVVSTAVAGTDYVTGAGLASAYPFQLTGNATSTLTQFNGGLTAFASSTIGAGGATTGLTIFGGATTTGNLIVQGTGTSTFAGNIGFTSKSVLQSSADGKLEFTTNSGAAPSYFKIGSTLAGGIALKNNGGVQLTLSRADETTGISLQVAQVRLAASSLASAGGASSLGSGGFAYATDLLNPVIGTTAAGGGTNNGLMYSDGTNWTIVGALKGRTQVGTTSPYAALSVHANPTDTYSNTTLFAIGSSTASATTTLFSVSNTGLITGLNFSLLNGTSTSFAISNIASGSLLKTTTGGAIIPAVAGTDYTTFGYLFPSNATSTLLTFSGGLTSAGQATFLNASSTAFSANTLSIGGTGTTSIASNGTLTTPSLTIGTGVSYSAVVDDPNVTLAITPSNATYGTTFRTAFLESAGILGAGGSSINTLYGTNWNVPLNFKVADVSGTYSEVGRFTVAGNFGINRTAPTYRLEVGGTGRFTSYVDATNFVATSTTLINSLPLITATTATTTNLAVTGITSSLLKTNSLGQLVAATQNVDYSAFSYLFPSNATSTLLSFNGGLTSFASSTIGAGAQATGLTIFGGATTTGNLLVQGSATSSAFAITGVTSSLLKTNATGAIIPAVAGTDYTTFGYLFPSNATSTLLAFNAGLTSFASSTIGAGAQATGLTIFGGATTTGNTALQGTLSVTGAAIFTTASISTSLAFGSAGSALGIDQGGSIELKATNATSLPYIDWSLTGRDYDFRQQLDLANYNLNLFSSTTASILTIKGNGNLGIGTTTPSQTLSVQGNSYISGTSFFGGAITATSTLTLTGVAALNGGLTSFASSTIGAGGQAAGLTIWGGATTTGNAYIAGNVGVGTTTPNASAQLHVLSASSDARIRIGSSAVVSTSNTASIDLAVNTTVQERTAGFIGALLTNTTDATRTGDLFLKAVNNGVLNEVMRLTGAGNVGIGTTTPSSPLTIGTQAGGGENLRLSPTAGGAEGGQLSLMDAQGLGAFEIDNAGAAGVESLRIFRDKNSENTGTFLSIGSGGDLIVDHGALYLPNAKAVLAKDSGGTNRTLLQLYSDNITYLDGGAGGLQIRSNNAAVDAIKVLASGYVGVGTTNPATKLTISGATDAAIRVVNTTTGNSEITLYDTTDGGATIFAQDGVTNIGTVNTSGTWTANRLSINNSTGNVGVGMTPGYKLDVNGDVRGASLIVGGSGTYVAGSIYSDASWGLLMRAASAGATKAFAVHNSADTDLLSITNAGVVTVPNLTASRLVTTDGSSNLTTTISSSNLATSITDETGTGSAVFNTSPTLTTPILGTPQSVTLTNATGLPVLTGISGLGTGVATALAVNVGSAGSFVPFNGALGTPSSGTLTNATGLPISSGVSGLGTGIASFLGTPTSANLATALTDETGTGAAVFAASPTLTGTLTAAAINASGAITGGTNSSFGGTTQCCAVSQTPTIAISEVGATKFPWLQFHASGYQEAYMRLATSSRLFEFGDSQAVGVGLAVMNNAGTARNVVISGNSSTYFNGGNVGIGTASPGSLLTVAGTGNFTGASGVGAVKINGAGGSWFWIDNPSSTLMRFSSGATPGTNSMIFSDAGYLGIGMTPSNILDVAAGTIGFGRGSSSATNIEVGETATGNHYAYMDLTGDSTYTDYGLRILRGNSGANTQSDIAHRGTGVLNITAVDAGSIVLNTQNTARITVDSSGNVGIGITPSFPVELHAGTDRNINFRNDPVSFGYPSTLAGVIMQSINDAQNAQKDLTFVANNLNFMPDFGMGIGTTTRDVDPTSGISPKLNVQGGAIELNMDTIAGGEVNDWPTAAFSIRRIDDFTTMRMAQFGHSKDAIYQTGNAVWNMSLVDNVGSKTTSDSNTALSIDGPGNLQLIPAGGGGVAIGTASPGTASLLVQNISKPIIFTPKGNDVVSDDIGFEIRNQGYTAGNYANRFVSKDMGGGIPLYMQGNLAGDGTSWTSLARLGSYSGNGNYFETFGQTAFNGTVAVGKATPNAGLDVSTNGGSDGVTIAQTLGDNTMSIQMYIDNQYSNRASYAGGCCNDLYIQPDVGNVHLAGGVTVDHSANVTGVTTITSSGSINVNGSSDGGIGSVIQNASNTSNAYSYFGTTNNSGSGVFLFMNSASRSADGGVNTATLRNDQGALRLLASGSVGLTIATTGTTTSTNGFNITAGCFSVNGTCVGGDTVVRLTAVRTGTASATWTKPASFSYAVVELWGAGGGGSGEIDNDTAGGGGGGGGYMQKQYTASALSSTSTVNVVVGAGGAGGAVTTGGSTGGTSNFGGMASSTGGAGGSLNTPSAAAGGTGQGGDVNLFGGNAAGATGGSAARGGGGKAGAVGSTYGGGGGSGLPINAYGGSGVGFAGGAGGYVIYEYTTVASGSDLAENYPVTDPSISAGDIVGFDSSTPYAVSRAIDGAHMPLAGVISTEPGIVLGDKDSIGQRPVALSGRVPVRVNFENGDIHVGDRIALSSVAGVGRKANQFDASVGVAIEDHSQASSTKDTVLVFLDIRAGVEVKEIGKELLKNWLPLIVATSTQTNSTSTAVAASSTEASLTNSIGVDFDFVDALFKIILLKLSTLGITIADGLTSIKNLAVESLTVGSHEKPAGITIYDDATGDPYCIKVVNGDMKNIPGTCASLMSASVVNATGDGSSSTSTNSNESGGTSTSTSNSGPLLIIQGETPTHVIVGALYGDAGVVITGEPNLQYEVSLDGATSTVPSMLNLDTSVEGTHTLTYSATDSLGRTGMATRTVIVEAASAAETSGSDNGTTTSDGEATSTLGN